MGKWVDCERNEIIFYAHYSLRYLINIMRFHLSIYFTTVPLRNFTLYDLLYFKKKSRDLLPYTADFLKSRWYHLKKFKWYHLKLEFIFTPEYYVSSDVLRKGIS